MDGIVENLHVSLGQTLGEHIADLFRKYTQWKRLLQLAERAFVLRAAAQVNCMRIVIHILACINMQLQILWSAIEIFLVGLALLIFLVFCLLGLPLPHCLPLGPLEASRSIRQERQNHCRVVHEAPISQREALPSSKGQGHGDLCQ